MAARATCRSRLCPMAGDTARPEMRTRKQRSTMGERTANVKPGDIGATLAKLAAVIAQRDASGADPKESYTARLLKGPEDYRLKKVVEEACEVTLAVKDGDHDHVRYEAADLIYHLLVVCHASGVTIDELAGELDARAH